MVCEKVTGVCEVYRSGSGRWPVLLELPHGATELSHFEELRSSLGGPFPSDLAKFFCVNTDVGTPELAFSLALDSSLEAFQFTIVRSLIPRTFIDCNRILPTAELSSEGAPVTALVPEYVKSPKDLSFLLERLGKYEEVVRREYHKVKEGQGMAVMLHSYAPRSVPISSVGADIVEQLQFHYDSARISTYPLRPEVDFIWRTSQKESPIDPQMLAVFRRRLSEAGFEVGEGESYPLHPATAGFRWAQFCSGRTLCVEIRRDLLMHEWSPFVPMQASPSKIQRVSEAFGLGIREWFDFSRQSEGSR